MQNGRPPLKPQRYVPRGAQAQLCWRRSADGTAAASGGKAIIRKVTLRICLCSAPSLTAGRLGWVAHRVGECNRVPLVVRHMTHPTYGKLSRPVHQPLTKYPLMMQGTSCTALTCMPYTGNTYCPFRAGRLKVNRAILHVGVCLNDGWLARLLDRRLTFLQSRSHGGED